jgi:hypothetical protein
MVQSFEQLNPRAVAVVVDPIQSVKGKVVTGLGRFCDTAHPRYTGFANMFGVSVSETAMRPNPRWSSTPSGPLTRR